MCFSPAASFSAAAVTGALGLIAVARATQVRELPLAATPLLFAVQQLIEGFIWLQAPMSPASTSGNGLVLAYLIFAQVLWPVWAPAAILSLERDPRRRRMIRYCLILGATVSAYFLWGRLAHSVSVTVRDGHLVYLTGRDHVAVMGAAYLAAVVLAPLLSSSRSVVALGVLVLVAWIAAYGAYFAAFQSVWCYFAAITSGVVIGHFEIVRRRASRAAAS